MATLENYEGSVVLISGITKPEGSKDYPLVEAHDILVGAGDKRLDAKLQEIEASGGNGGGSYVLELQVELTDGEEPITGVLTADQCTDISANAPNVFVKLTGLEDAVNIYIPLIMTADGQYAFVAEIENSMVTVIADCANSVYSVMVGESPQGGGDVDAESILNSAKSYTDSAKADANRYTDSAKAEAKSYTDSVVQSALASYITEVDNLVGGGL
jgi:hypothetical protein